MRDWTRDNPALDAEDSQDTKDSVIGRCEECGHDIYKGQFHYEINGILLCDEYDCLKNYMWFNYGKED